jgi:hypothetical protein
MTTTATHDHEIVSALFHVPRKIGLNATDTQSVSEATTLEQAREASLSRTPSVPTSLSSTPSFGACPFEISTGRLLSEPTAIETELDELLSHLPGHDARHRAEGLDIFVVDADGLRFRIAEDVGVPDDKLMYIPVLPYFLSSVSFVTNRRRRRGELVEALVLIVVKGRSRKAHRLATCLRDVHTLVPERVALTRCRVKLLYICDPNTVYSEYRRGETYGKAHNALVGEALADHELRRVDDLILQAFLSQLIFKLRARDRGRPPRDEDDVSIHVFSSNSTYENVRNVAEWAKPAMLGIAPCAIFPIDFSDDPDSKTAVVARVSEGFVLDRCDVAVLWSMVESLRMYLERATPRTRWVRFHSLQMAQKKFIGNVGEDVRNGVWKHVRKIQRLHKADESRTSDEVAFETLGESTVGALGDALRREAERQAPPVEAEVRSRLLPEVFRKLHEFGGAVKMSAPLLAEELVSERSGPQRQVDHSLRQPVPTPVRTGKATRSGTWVVKKEFNASNPEPSSCPKPGEEVRAVDVALVESASESSPAGDAFVLRICAEEDEAKGLGVALSLSDLLLDSSDPVAKPDVGKPLVRSLLRLCVAMERRLLSPSESSRGEVGFVENLCVDGPHYLVRGWCLMLSFTSSLYRFLRNPAKEFEWEVGYQCREGKTLTRLHRRVRFRAAEIDISGSDDEVLAAMAERAFAEIEPLSEWTAKIRTAWSLSSASVDHARGQLLFPVDVVWRRTHFKLAPRVSRFVYPAWPPSSNVASTESSVAKMREIGVAKLLIEQTRQVKGGEAVTAALEQLKSRTEEDLRTHTPLSSDRHAFRFGLANEAASVVHRRGAIKATAAVMYDPLDSSRERRFLVIPDAGGRETAEHVLEVADRCFGFSRKFDFSRVSEASMITDAAGLRRWTVAVQVRYGVRLRLVGNALPTRNTFFVIRVGLARLSVLHEAARGEAAKTWLLEASDLQVRADESDASDPFMALPRNFGEPLFELTVLPGRTTGRGDAAILALRRQVTLSCSQLLRQNLRLRTGCVHLRSDAASLGRFEVGVFEEVMEGGEKRNAATLSKVYNVSRLLHQLCRRLLRLFRLLTSRFTFEVRLTFAEASKASASDGAVRFLRVTPTSSDFASYRLEVSESRDSSRRNFVLVRDVKLTDLRAEDEESSDDTFDDDFWRWYEKEASGTASLKSFEDVCGYLKLRSGTSSADLELRLRHDELHELLVMKFRLLCEEACDSPRISTALENDALRHLASVIQSKIASSAAKSLTEKRGVWRWDRMSAWQSVNDRQRASSSMSGHGVAMPRGLGVITSSKMSTAKHDALNVLMSRSEE